MGAFLDCLCGEGGHVTVDDGTEIEASAAEDTALTTPKLQAYALEKRRISAGLITYQQFRMRVHIYRLPADGTAHVQVSFDGRRSAKWNLAST